jgi:hypothetical protein
MRIRYRIGQFWNAFAARPSTGQLERAHSLLGDPLMTLFQGMQPGEQAHSLQIFDSLIAQDETDPDLLAAALLHDLGKSRIHLNPFERALVVIGNHLLPSKAAAWGQAEPHGWKRAFVVAAQHPAWGADMAQKAGASPVTVRLIRQHQDRLPPAMQKRDPLLYRLQLLDDKR